MRFARLQEWELLTFTNNHDIYSKLDLKVLEDEVEKLRKSNARLHIELDSNWTICLT